MAFEKLRTALQDRLAKTRSKYETARDIGKTAVGVAKPIVNRTFNSKELLDKVVQQQPQSVSKVYDLSNDVNEFIFGKEQPSITGTPIPNKPLKYVASIPVETGKAVGDFAVYQTEADRIKRATGLDVTAKDILENPNLGRMLSQSGETGLALAGGANPAATLKSLGALTAFDAATSVPIQFGKDVGRALTEDTRGDRFTNTQQALQGVGGRIGPNIPRAGLFGATGILGEGVAQQLGTGRVGQTGITGALNVAEDYALHGLGLREKPTVSSNLQAFGTPFLVEGITGKELEQEYRGLGERGSIGTDDYYKDNIKMTEDLMDKAEKAFDDGDIKRAEDLVRLVDKRELEFFRDSGDGEMPISKDVERMLRKINDAKLEGGKQTNDLLSQARKFDSAEEFIKAQGDVVYRGEGGQNEFAGKMGGIAGRNYASDIDRARTFGDVQEYVVPNDAKVYKANWVGKELEDIATELDIDGVPTASKIQKALLNKGYDAIEVTTRLGIDGEITDSSPVITDLVELKDGVLKPKSQLKDIWNRARNMR